MTCSNVDTGDTVHNDAKYVSMVSIEMSESAMFRPVSASLELAGAVTAKQIAD